MSRAAFVDYGEATERVIGKITSLMRTSYRLRPRAIALLLLQGDAEMMDMVRAGEGDGYNEIESVIRESGEPARLAYSIALRRRETARQLLTESSGRDLEAPAGSSARDYDPTIRPITGIPILLAVVYFGMYLFVGKLGAGVMVNFLEQQVFGDLLGPSATRFLQAYIPWTAVQSLLTGEYGVITLGLRYALAIILPIVGTYFFAFAIMEDTGYLPRLALLLDRIFKSIGLSGRAVIPMVLGFGCDTMATVVSRTLETERERIIATFLLALAIPCSAQLGVILGLLSAEPAALLAWVGFLSIVFLLVAYLTSRLLPGEAPSFYMEVPPLRMPQVKNVLSKTYARMYWYLAEVLPVFLATSVVLWAGDKLGLIAAAGKMVEPIVRWIGLPVETANVFLFGFFRRDYGAAGLYDLAKSGLLTARQLLVACATLTLFVPCIAQFAVMVKERGTKTAVAIAAFIFPFAFLMGKLLNWITGLMGVF